MNPDYAALAKQYQTALLDDVMPFWSKHSVDRECGGYYTCLDRDGSVFDTDKFIWLQARQVWTYAMLYNRIERREEWLDIARIGAGFLGKHGHDAGGNWYFSLDRQGNPLIQPYNIFSDCFASMAFSQYALAADDDEARAIALDTYNNILRRKDNPKGQYTKAYPGTRPMIALAIPMILANLSLELEELLEPAVLEMALDQCIHEVMNLFLDKENLILLEHRAPDGKPLDCFEGRVVLPGHGIEAMWFLMDVGQRREDTALVEDAKNIMLSLLNYGWDVEHEGLFYFLDCKGYPQDQLEWDRKLWWAHAESLVGLLMGYRLTNDPACWEWFERVHDYTWSHFADPDYGEWFGYLDREGRTFLNLKGGKWKGCFHVPRALLRCWKELEAIGRVAGP